MKRFVASFIVSIAVLACGNPSSYALAEAAIDADLEKYIAGIRAVDNHTHVNTVVPDDKDYDALPLGGIPEFPLPVRLRPDNPEWIAAYRAVYGYAHDDLSDQHMAELRDRMQGVAREQGEKFPEWVLDKVGTEVMLANRIAMGPGLAPPRFRWVSYVDALLLPLSTAKERTTPDYAALYPLEDKLLQRYLADLKIAKLPASLDDYERQVVTPTLESQKKGGCIGVKFEVAYLRGLDFDDAAKADAARVYAKYVRGGEPAHAEYKELQDYLFRVVAREAGRLGLAVHIHAFEGAGGYYRIAGSDPLLLESALNDPSLRKTNFVILHGGGIFASHTGAMLGRANVYADMSAMVLLYPTSKMAAILRDWLSQYPEKVLFASDAFAGGPDAGWELTAWLGTTTGRKALTIALTGMMRDGEISRARAEEIATMVMRSNASKLYGLGLK